MRMFRQGLKSFEILSAGVRADATSLNIASFPATPTRLRFCLHTMRACSHCAGVTTGLTCAVCGRMQYSNGRHCPLLVIVAAAKYLVALATDMRRSAIFPPLVMPSRICIPAKAHRRSCLHRQLRNGPHAVWRSQWRSLPHRQLRKINNPPRSLIRGSLPHRQLRKPRDCARLPRLGSLPHRQLRKLETPRASAAKGSLPHRQLKK
jgi:RNA polymerase subunit RPABC4/transcription elongation factor Spt4